MTKINNLDDFHIITSSITSFSHAYLFNTNSLTNILLYAKDFAKKIICENMDKEEIELTSYQIDNDEYDDLYIVNPDTIGIKNEEIEKLFQVMMTKSLRKNGRRVYIIYGFERLSRDVSNKILKFLEEPVDNLYGILLTENIDHILSTIISRCQIINITFDKDDLDKDLVNSMKLFLTRLKNKGSKTIAYNNEFFGDLYADRIKMYDAFQIIEIIFSNLLRKIYNNEYDTNLDIADYHEIPTNSIVNIMDITNKLKMLIKQNINLNLLIDRYIIEVSKELDYAKNSRNNV